MFLLQQHMAQHWCFTARLELMTTVYCVIQVNLPTQQLENPKYPDFRLFRPLYFIIHTQF